MAKKLNAQDILADINKGLRTRHFLQKYGIDKEEFQHILKRMIRDGILTKEQFKQWKAHRPVEPEPQKAQASESKGTVSTFEDTVDMDQLRKQALGDLSLLDDEDPVHQEAAQKEETAPETKPQKGVPGSVETYVITEPEKNGAWVLDLFATKRDEMEGLRFKARIMGKKYGFTVEKMLFRGPVNIFDNAGNAGKPKPRDKREEALNFISSHGWAAYLESRAIEANIEEQNQRQFLAGRLMVLKCMRQTYVAALHSPAPSVSFYVASDLESIKRRLEKNVDMTNVRLG
jgi:hypothetical protein